MCCCLCPKLNKENQAGDDHVSYHFKGRGVQKMAKVERLGSGWLQGKQRMAYHARRSKEVRGMSVRRGAKAGRGEGDEGWQGTGQGATGQERRKEGRGGGGTGEEGSNRVRRDRN